MFESLLMQLNSTVPIITTQPVQTDVATTITALIVGIGGLLGAIAAVMQSASQRKELGKHGEALHGAAVRLGELGEHMIESKEDIKSLAEVTYDFAPDKAKEIVNQQNIKLQELTKKLADAETNLKKVPPVLERI